MPVTFRMVREAAWSLIHAARRARRPMLPGQIGPYKILDVLGEGAMGTVYLAEQKEPVRRRVALKVIKLGMDSKAVLARFEAERKALALMEHSCIATVFDAGLTAQGQPWFAMEYVKGVPITQYCDQQRLGIEARIALFQRVCSGVQHAHLKGVMHRDLKPSNVLVTVQDGQPLPKIIDFGLAKATDHHLVEATLFTEQGQVLGTPEYMSPEQAGLGGLDVDTRTDVYSLGVLLYELLAGELPFSQQELRTQGQLEMQRVIREREPVRPSTRISSGGEAAAAHAASRRLAAAELNRKLRGDLDWIVLKALEKDRTRRYETALELAADLQRHVDLEPVLAGPPSTAYRLRKFAARNRGLLLAAAAVLVTLCAGLAVSWRLYLRSEDNAAAAGRMALAAKIAQARSEMWNVDLAVMQCAAGIYEARVPEKHEVLSSQRENPILEVGREKLFADPWGNDYDLQPGPAPGTWVVHSNGPDGAPATNDDLVHDNPRVARMVAARLEQSTRQRAKSILDDCSKWYSLERPPASVARIYDLPGHRGAAYALDPWGREMVVREREVFLEVRSGGADGRLDTADDLAEQAIREAERMTPEQVRAAAGSGKVVECYVQLHKADLQHVFNFLRPFVAGSFLTLTNGSGNTIRVRGPAAGVASAIDQIERVDANYEPEPGWIEQGRDLARGMLREHGFRDEVIAALRAEPQTDLRVLGQALIEAATIEDTPQRLNTLAWEIVVVPGAEGGRYALALRAAAAADAGQPDDKNILNTLGVAQFRAGDDRAAVATLRRSDALNGGVPADVAFLAMALQRLGEHAAADQEYERLRRLMQEPRHATDAENVGFLREAEALFGR